MKTQIIYELDKYRILEILDDFANMEDLKGDCYDPKCNPDIDPDQLKREEKEFEELVYREGVFGYVLRTNGDCVDMKLYSEVFGECEVILSIGVSSVDTYVESARSEKLGRELTDSECDQLQQELDEEIQFYSYSEGGSINHN